jgi:hypothetical protein
MTRDLLLAVFVASPDRDFTSTDLRRAFPHERRLFEMLHGLVSDGLVSTRLESLPLPGHEFRPQRRFYRLSPKEH